MAFSSWRHPVSSRDFREGFDAITKEDFDMKHGLIGLIMVCVVGAVISTTPTWAQESDSDGFVEIPAEVLWDKIRGGLLGQMLGNLNGIEHEMQYINEPGNVTEYTPALPEGARTDDDTDFEWVYINVMQDREMILIPVEEIADLWRNRINRRVWCSNQYARVLMDLGLEPPLTGNIALNPWADFNISGQFLCETFGIIAPGMPQTAGRIGLHYTRVAIDGEPAQTTQMFTAMIATAYLTDDVATIIDAGVASLDSRSVLNEIVSDVRKWHSENPDDWRATRLEIKNKYSLYDGAMRDRNGYELNSASVIGPLLYGKGDFAETLRMAFNFGWDADNTAATAGTILGVARGYRWMMAEGWDIRDRYANVTRDGMPMDETITSFADRLITLSEQVIAEQGGERIVNGGDVSYRIRTQKPANVAPLPTLSGEMERMQVSLKSEIEDGLLKGADGKSRARAAYLAIALGLSDPLKKAHPEEWIQAMEDLIAYPQVAQVLYHHSPIPAADPIRERANSAGLETPNEEEGVWLWDRTTRQARGEFNN
jgi:hypothetical protein